jgi:hypothetical protein
MLGIEIKEEYFIQIHFWNFQIIKQLPCNYFFYRQCCLVQNNRRTDQLIKTKRQILIKGHNKLHNVFLLRGQNKQQVLFVSNGHKKELGHPKVLGHNKHPGLLALKENTKIKRTCPSGTAVN